MANIHIRTLGHGRHSPPPTENMTPIAFARRVLSLATLGIWSLRSV